MGISVRNDIINLNYADIRKASLVLRAINHKLRQNLIFLLKENGKMTVTEIYVKMRLGQSVISQHLAILRRSGIVKTTREGKCVYYFVNYSRIAAIMNDVNNILNYPIED